MLARSSSGNIYYQRSEGIPKNSKFLKTRRGDIVGGSLTAGITYGGGYAISYLTTIGTGFSVTGHGAPIVLIEAAFCLSIGALFGLFS